MNHNKLSQAVLSNQHLIGQPTSVPPDQQYFLYQMLLRKYENFYDSICSLVKNYGIEKGFSKALKGKAAILDLSVTFGSVKAISAFRQLKERFLLS